METLARLVTHFRDYHPIEPCRATLDLDADPPAYTADVQDIKGAGVYTQIPLGALLSRGRGGEVKVRNEGTPALARQDICETRLYS